MMVFKERIVRRIPMIGVLFFAACTPALADLPFVDGKMRLQEFYGSWDGPDPLWSEAGGNAAQYVDSESDYVGYSCSSVFPASLMYPCSETPLLHGQATITAGADGFTECSGTVDGNGYCTGAMMMNVKTTLNDDQPLWCHELGHAFGAAHGNGYNGCMDDTVSTTYDPHHISQHLQYENGPPH
jgi:hypothetical protein